VVESDNGSGVNIDKTGIEIANRPRNLKAMRQESMGDVEEMMKRK